MGMIGALLFLYHAHAMVVVPQPSMGVCRQIARIERSLPHAPAVACTRPIGVFV